jgi:hypothetical protein
MSALNLIGINFQQAKRKKKEQFDQSGWVILDKSSSYRIPKDSARKRKKALVVARAESGDGRCGGNVYLGRC